MNSGSTDRGAQGGRGVRGPPVRTSKLHATRGAALRSSARAYAQGAARTVSLAHRALQPRANPLALLSFPTIIALLAIHQAIDPHFFAVALAIQLSAQPESDYYGEELQFGSKLSFFIASEVNNAAANAALPEAFEQLMCRAEDAELVAVAEDLRDEITEIESPDALLDRLQCLADAVQRDVDIDGGGKRLIDPQSVVGRFVREIVLVYNSLLFEGVARLFEAVERYAAVGPAAQPPTHSDTDDDSESRARGAVAPRPSEAARASARRHGGGAAAPPPRARLASR